VCFLEVLFFGFDVCVCVFGVILCFLFVAYFILCVCGVCVFGIVCVF